MKGFLILPFFYNQTPIYSYSKFYILHNKH